MSVQRLSQTRWRVRVKAAGREVYTRVHSTRREAVADEAMQRARLSAGEWLDPRAGRVPVSEVAAAYLAARPGRVAEKTAVTERYLLGRMTARLARLPIAAVQPADVEADLVTQAADLSRGSLRRYRGVLSALMTHAVESHLRAGNPVTRTRLPETAADQSPTTMQPFTLEELRTVVADLVGVHADGDLALVLGLSGLRWGELAALRVGEVLEVPRPALRVSRSAPTGHAERSTTKGGRARTVPLAADAVPVVRRWAAGKEAHDLLFTNTRGGRLNGWAWKQLVNWPTHARGRRVHDLRHTAATIWPTSGVPLKTAQAWLGHSSATLTADVYAHYLPGSADEHGLAALNLALGGTSGAPSTRLKGVKRSS